MKRISHVYENLSTPKNLELAILSACRNKGQKSKVTQAQVEWVKECKIGAILHMGNELERFEKDPEHTIIFHKHETCKIHDDSCNKDRIIVKPPFLYEQIYHHAVIQVILNVIMKGMYEYSCGSIPQRGGTYGKKYLERFIRKHPDKCKYYLKMDIHHFFQNISHKKMLELISRYIKDERYLKLIKQLIESYEDSPGKGLPIGYYTSQWFANWYLQSFDHYVKEQLHAPFYIRYMDDMVVIGPNKRELVKMSESIKIYLKELGLELNNKTVICELKEKPLDFMGYQFHFGYTTLRKSIVVHATRLAKRINEDGYNWVNCCRELSLLGWLMRTDSYNVYRDYIKVNVNVPALKEAVSNHAKALKMRKEIKELREEVAREQAELAEVYKMMEEEGLLEYYRWIDEPIDFRGPAELKLIEMMRNAE